MPGDEVAAAVLGAVRAVEAATPTTEGPLFHALHVRVALDGAEAMVHLRLSVRYGVRLPEVLPRLQQQIESHLQNAFGFTSVRLTIDVRDLYFDEAR